MNNDKAGKIDIRIVVVINAVIFSIGLLMTISIIISSLLFLILVVEFFYKKSVTLSLL